MCPIAALFGNPRLPQGISEWVYGKEICFITFCSAAVYKSRSTTL